MIKKWTILLFASMLLVELTSSLSLGATLSSAEFTSQKDVYDFVIEELTKTYQLIEEDVAEVYQRILDQAAKLIEAPSYQVQARFDEMKNFINKLKEIKELPTGPARMSETAELMSVLTKFERRYLVTAAEYPGEIPDNFSLRRNGILRCKERAIQRFKDVVEKFEAKMNVYVEGFTEAQKHKYAEFLEWYKNFESQIDSTEKFGEFATILSVLHYND